MHSKLGIKNGTELTDTNKIKIEITKIKTKITNFYLKLSEKLRIGRLV